MLTFSYKRLPLNEKFGLINVSITMGTIILYHNGFSIFHPLKCLLHENLRSYIKQTFLRIKKTI